MPEDKKSLAPYVAGGAGATIGAGALVGGGLLAKKYGPGVVALAKKLGTTVDDASKLVKSIDKEKVKGTIESFHEAGQSAVRAAKTIPEDIRGATENIGKATKSIAGAGESIGRAGESLTGSGKAIERASGAVEKRMQSPIAGAPEAVSDVIAATKAKVKSKLPFGLGSQEKSGSALLDDIVLGPDSHTKTAADQFAELLGTMDKQAVSGRLLSELGQGAIVGGTIGAAGGGLTGMVSGAREGKPGQGAALGALAGLGTGAGVGAGLRPLAGMLARKGAKSDDLIRELSERAAQPVTRADIAEEVARRAGKDPASNLSRLPTKSTIDSVPDSRRVEVPMNEAPRAPVRDDVVQALKDRVEGRPASGTADVVDIARKQEAPKPSLRDEVESRRIDELNDEAAKQNFYGTSANILENAVPFAAGGGALATGAAAGSSLKRDKKGKK